jgi:hypothetical protein
MRTPKRAVCAFAKPKIARALDRNAEQLRRRLCHRRSGWQSKKKRHPQRAMDEDVLFD